MTRMQSEDPEAVAAVQHIVDTIVSGQRDKVADMVSLPFWMDTWFTDREQVRAKMGGNEGVPTTAKMQLRIYPLSDLAVLKPRFWDKIKTAEPAWLADLTLGAIAIELDGRIETGFLLLRRVDGQWRLAGLLEE